MVNPNARLLGAVAILISLQSFSLLAAPQTAVGLMLTPGGADIVRSGSRSSSKAKAGDLVYAGDTIRAGSSAVTFLYCPGQRALTISPSAEVLVSAQQLTFHTGQMASQRPVTACFLPPEVRLADASTQKFGTLVARGEEDQPVRPTRAADWPAGLADELDPVRRALVVNPNDPAALLAFATLFEKYGLPGDALIVYRELAKVWIDVPWLTGKMTELNQMVAIRQAQGTVRSQMK